jgi:hypothetical protein
MEFQYPKASVLFWMIINLVVEIGQGVDESYFNALPSFIKHYFQHGVFDWYDILSILIGAFLAYGLISKLKQYI